MRLKIALSVMPVVLTAPLAIVLLTFSLVNLARALPP